MRILLAGSGRLGVSAIQAVESAGHEIVGLLLNGREIQGFGRAIYSFFSPIYFESESPMGYAARRKYPMFWISKMTDHELEPIRALKPDLIVVCGFGVILKRPIIELPRIGCINIHSSLLPKHRGPNPFAAVIMAQETESGVTFHQVDEGIDTGNIVFQSRFAMDPQDTQYVVYDKACREVREHLGDVLTRINESGIQGTPQDPALATYDKGVTPEMLQVRWDMTAEEIARLVRAYGSNPMPYFMHGKKKVRIRQVTCDATPVDEAPGTVLARNPFPVIATGEGTITLNLAYTLSPVPLLWPRKWGGPWIGQRLR